MSATVRGGRRTRQLSDRDDTPHLSRLQRSILWLLQIRGGRLWLVDVACELRNEGATADMVKEALHGLTQGGFICLSDGAYEVTLAGQTHLDPKRARKSGHTPR
jgi:hypothetical protein